MPDLKVYEVVIGLELHVQLLTKSKLFFGDSTLFGNPPNTNICANSLAHPGTLPAMNEKALELAIKLALAFNCDISRKNYFERKNYFYPELPSEVEERLVKKYDLSHESVKVICADKSMTEYCLKRVTYTTQ